MALEVNHILQLMIKIAQQQKVSSPVSPVLAASPSAHLSVSVADTASTHADVFDTVEILEGTKQEKAPL